MTRILFNHYSLPSDYNSISFQVEKETSVENSLRHFYLINHGGQRLQVSLHYTIHNGCVQYAIVMRRDGHAREQVRQDATRRCVCKLMNTVYTVRTESIQSASLVSHFVM